MARSKADIEAITGTGRGDKKTRVVIGSLVVLAAALAAVWFWLGKSASHASARYSTDPARISDIVVTVTATGTVEATNQVEVSSELSGTIRSVEVDYNDPVKIGQVLARLDTDKLEATVEHSRASLAAVLARLAESQATLEEKQGEYERAVKLEKRGFATVEALLASKAALRRAEAMLKSAEADVRVAEADLKLNEANLAKACICASIDGIVLDRNVEVGQIVASSFQTPVLFTIAEDLRQMEIQIDIDEADIGKVAVGNKATFTVEAYQERSFPAVISQLRYMPETVDGVVTYKAVLSIENEDLLLRPGMTATAEITVAEIGGALVVANAALRFVPPASEETRPSGGSGLLGLVFRGRPSADAITGNEPGEKGLRTVYLLRDKAPVPVEVRTGSTDGTVTEILEGALSPGDAVITDVADAQ